MCESCAIYKSGQSHSHGTMGAQSWSLVPCSILGADDMVMVPRTIINKTWQSFIAKRRINRTISCCQFPCTSSLILGGHMYIQQQLQKKSGWVANTFRSLYKFWESRMHGWLRFVQVPNWMKILSSFNSFATFLPPTTYHSFNYMEVFVVCFIKQFSDPLIRACISHFIKTALNCFKPTPENSLQFDLFAHSYHSCANTQMGTGLQDIKPREGLGAESRKMGL